MKKNNQPQKEIHIQEPKDNSIDLNDYIIYFFALCFLAIDFLPQFRSIDILGAQYFYLAVLNLVIGVFLFYNPSFSKLNYLRDFKQSIPTKLYGIFLLFCFLSIIGARNFSLWIVHISQILITAMMIFNFCLLLYNRLHLLKQNF